MWSGTLYLTNLLIIVFRQLEGRILTVNLYKYSQRGPELGFWCLWLILTNMMTVDFELESMSRGHQSHWVASYGVHIHWQGSVSNCLLISILDSKQTGASWIQSNAAKILFCLFWYRSFWGPSQYFYFLFTFGVFRTRYTRDFMYLLGLWIKLDPKCE